MLDQEDIEDGPEDNNGCRRRKDGQMRRYNPCIYLPRRLQIILASLTALVLLSCILLSPPSIRVKIGAGHPPVNSLNTPTPNWLNPFTGPAHTPPPEQANSSSFGSRWYADYKWPSAFSSSVTFDEERAVLPPLPQRPPVYTYVAGGNSRRQDEKGRRAEQELMQIWRRAWWAQGFNPIILGEAEAMNSPLYQLVERLELEPEFEMEMMRWSAWANVGTGILSSWLAVPMAAYDHPTLAFLRRGEYPELTRYEGMENGLFVGRRDAIEAALKDTVNTLVIKRVKSVVEATPEGTFTVDKEPSAIAFYGTSAIKAKYDVIWQKLDDKTTSSEGLAMLPPLINSHLHMTWQNHFSSGIAVLKPLPEHTTSLIEPAIHLAGNLSQCSHSPIPASCPPNRPRCKPCVSSQMLVTTPAVFRNTSTLFTIATLPHPYTLTSLIHTTDDLSLRFIRRETNRDSWILAATQELLGTELSSFVRLPYLKQAVASENGTSRSLWLTAEHAPDLSHEKELEELDWIFGFQIPRNPIPAGKSQDPVPGRDRRSPKQDQEYGHAPVTTDVDLVREHDLLEKATLFLQRAEHSDRKGTLAGVAHMISGASRDQEVFGRGRDIVEAWNLADTEAWKFVRAFNARRSIEWRKWEKGDGDSLLGEGGGVVRRLVN